MLLTITCTNSQKRWVLPQHSISRWESWDCTVTVRFTDQTFVEFVLESPNHVARALMALREAYKLCSAKDQEVIVACFSTEEEPVIEDIEQTEPALED